MVRLPETSPAYHNYFIHEFFFPVINAYNGVLVNFLWKGLKGQYVSQPTDILLQLPIRKNDKVIQYNYEYFTLVTEKEQLNNNYKKIITFQNEVVAIKEQEWQPISSSKHALK